jgi:hypothetical protein
MWGLVVELEAHCLHMWKAEFLFEWLLAKHGCSSKQTGEATTIMSLTCHGVESFMWLLTGSSVLRGAFDVGYSTICLILSVQVSPHHWQLFPNLSTWMVSQNGETAGVLRLRQGLEGTLCMHANCFYHLSALVYRSSGFKKVLACLFVATTLYSLYER